MATLFLGNYIIDSAQYENFSKIVHLTRAEFDALTSKNQNTIYVITDENSSTS